MKTLICITAVALAPIFVQPAHAEELKEMTVVEKAIVVLHPTKGNKVEGTLTFTKTGEGLRVMGKVSGLSPGKHGFHIHQYGDTSSPDGTSAGGHFNPTDQPHAGPTEEHRHKGDFGNIEAGADGIAEVDFVDTHIALEGANSILGRGVVVHAKADDLTSQPSGNAGERVAVGVIGVAKN